jgi:hypothetical protein
VSAAKEFFRRSTTSVQDSVAPARPNRTGLDGAGRVVLQVRAIVKPMAMSNGSDRGNWSHCGPDYLTIDGSRRRSELVPTSRRAVQLDLGYRFLLRLVAPLQ